MRVKVFDKTLDSYQSRAVPTFTCPATHPFMVGADQPDRDLLPIRYDHGGIGHQLGGPRSSVTHWHLADSWVDISLHCCRYYDEH